MKTLIVLFSVLVGLQAAAQDYLRRPITDDVIYFLVLDRFAKDGPVDPSLPDVDPNDLRKFHGGDLRSATAKLDYLKDLGATAVWITPIFGNDRGGYHGYWILDFLHVDPHFGAEQDLRFFIEEAHRRDIKVFLDIVVNHTADVIRYRECPDNKCPYRSKADFPYSRGNPGFTGENFERLTNPNYAYTPYVPAGREHAKTPDWLNDLRYYHNRGNSTFKGESALLGDFSGLDDVFTENPRVVEGFIEIYRHWIEAFHVDGFRIDTARHVDVTFWQKFNPAMLDAAHKQGIANFYIFGEVADFTDDSVQLARFTREAKFPATLDFAFYDIVDHILANTRPASDFGRIYQADPLFDDALAEPLFVSNHDDGRLGFFIRQTDPGEHQARIILGHALMMFSRGVPILYYGDEQGFAGEGGDILARQDMFGHFDRTHPLFRAFAEMAELRRGHAALRHGQMLLRPISAPEIIAFSRLDAQEEIVVAVNTAGQPRDGAIEVTMTGGEWKSLHGDCAMRERLPGSYSLTLKPLSYVVCVKNRG